MPTERKGSGRLSVILAVYNESGNIAPLVDGILNVIGTNDELIVVDDGSTDTTATELEGKRIALIRHSKNRGKGAAMRTGIAQATGELILFMDGDGQDEPNEIPRVVGPIAKRADFVIGSRFLQGDEQGFITPTNLIGNKILTAMINVLFGIQITDSQASFKCIRADLLRKLHLTSDEYEIETEMLIKAIRQGCKIVEVPISRYRRKYGISNLYQVPLGRMKFALRTLIILLKGYFLWR